MENIIMLYCTRWVGKRVFLLLVLIFLINNTLNAQNRYKGQILEKSHNTKKTDTLVLLLQYDLYYLGYGIFLEPHGGVTGIYNDATVRAVKAFQTDNDVIPDGVFAKKTAIAMEAALQKSALEDQWNHFDPLRYNGKKLRKNDGGMALSKEIILLQDDLALLGYNVDQSEKGVFGVQTEKALKIFQEEYLLPSSGILDDRTVITLAEKICTQTSNKKSDK
jgi:peptidoglycan hydrolase-like protein with peptidoglycan-binding domain